LEKKQKNHSGGKGQALAAAVVFLRGAQSLLIGAVDLPLLGLRMCRLTGASFLADRPARRCQSVDLPAFIAFGSLKEKAARGLAACRGILAE
jgi:hypothetical protein